MILPYIKHKFDGYKTRRLLKKYNCKTLQEYKLLTDTSINYRSTTVSGFYHGYKHVVRIPDHYNHSDFDVAISIFTNWCEKNCKHKWRRDWHRVYTSWSNGTVVQVSDDINGISGCDFIYYAFQCEKDYHWFLLSHQL